jgi:dual-specificity kinase
MEQSRFFCLVFEVLGSSLYDFLELNEFRGFWMQDIAKIAKQSLQALSFLHGKLKLAHTDLKLENILLQYNDPPTTADFPRLGRHTSRGLSSVGPYLRPVRPDVKLIDFGNGTYELDHHSSIINTRQYRAPEVLLSLGWEASSDLWSIGCCFMELYTGELLFHTHDNQEHLALIERIIEPFPQDMLEKTPESLQEKFLASKGSAGGGSERVWRVAWPENAPSAKSQAHVSASTQIVKQVERHHKGFADFVKTLLSLQADQRPTAAEALKSSFFEEPFAD